MEPEAAPAPTLLLGPMLRHVEETSASLWVETNQAGTVGVETDAGTWVARTFGVHGHHYALVALDGLAAGAELPYRVTLDGHPVWPESSDYPPSVIRTPGRGVPLRLAFGSCRTSVPHDAAGNRKHGVDALRSYAVHMASAHAPDWPGLALLLGDQVYADVTSNAMQEFIRSRRDINEPPGAELRDFEEYAHLYGLAWSEPAIRWLFSTLPTAMIFDDHDIRDDWNASLSWRRSMEATSWWHDRIVAGLGSYWVYQHLGNLSPAERARDPLWQRITGHDGDAELDLSADIDAFADRADREPTTYRWSYCRDFDDVRLLVVDSRAARALEPGSRSLLDDEEMAWVEQRLHGGFRHLLIGTSLPFLLPNGLHHVESWDEAISEGAWGRTWSRIGETVRQAVDLEHWAAFQSSFRRVAGLVTDTADGRRGTAPRTVAFLSGDVHFSYASEVKRDTGSRIIQAVCSPMRNPMPPALRLFASSMAYGPARLVGSVLARAAGVPPPPLDWSGIRGPWFDNNLAILEDSEQGLRISWSRGVVKHDDGGQPRWEIVADITVGQRDAGGTTSRQSAMNRLRRRWASLRRVLRGRR
ncbi:alkaline phosphatase D family protein [Arthrobacter sp. JSM 101049]|uniref:alkaline phosphatase D family protein n=1 Tax=Arthrobacter sp. JSM 101049 TaxID=929097 RepID=UPI0035696EF1